MKIRKITKEENEKISKLVEEIVKEEKDKEDTEAIYINSYRSNETDFIEISVVKKCFSSHNEVLLTDANLSIKKVYVPKITFNQGIEIGNFKDLFDGILVVDNIHEEFKKLKEDLQGFDFSIYGIGKSDNHVTFEPPLNIKKVKKLK